MSDRNRCSSGRLSGPPATRYASASDATPPGTVEAAISSASGAVSPPSSTIGRPRWRAARRGPPARRWPPSSRTTTARSRPPAGPGVRRRRSATGWPVGTGAPPARAASRSVFSHGQQHGRYRAPPEVRTAGRAAVRDRSGGASRTVSRWSATRSPRASRRASRRAAHTVSGAAVEVPAGRGGDVAEERPAEPVALEAAVPGCAPDRADGAARRGMAPPASAVATPWWIS